jgi:hypothetical protein
METIDVLATMLFHPVHVDNCLSAVNENQRTKNTLPLLKE